MMSKWKTRAFCYLQRLYAGSQQKWEAVVQYLLPGRDAGQTEKQQAGMPLGQTSIFQSDKTVRQTGKQQSNEAVQQADKPEPLEKKSFFSAWAGGLGSIFPRGYLLLAGAYIFALLLLVAVFTAKQGKIPFLELPGKVGNGVEYGLPAENVGCEENETSNSEPKETAGAEGGAASSKSANSAASGEREGSAGSSGGTGSAVAGGAAFGEGVSSAVSSESANCAASGGNAGGAGAGLPAGSSAGMPAAASGDGTTVANDFQKATAAGTTVTAGDIAVATTVSPPSPLPQAASPLPVWEVCRPYGEYTSKELPSGGRLHAFTQGLDLMATPGAPVAALWDGRVSKIGGSGSGDSSPYSQFVVLEHDGGYVTFYGNLREIWVEEGRRVYRGEDLGLLPHLPLKTVYKGALGETGTSSAGPFEADNPLLYLEVRQGHSYLDPLFFIGVRN